MSVVTVNKNLENRYQALKWMYAQSATGFLGKEILSKFHVPTSFLSATSKKALTKSSGRDGSKYIGEEPTIKTAVEVYDFEKQMLGRKNPCYGRKTINIKGLDKFKDVVDKATKTQVPVTEEKHILPTKKTTSALNISIIDGMVTLTWEDFSKLMNK